MKVQEIDKQDVDLLYKAAESLSQRSVIMKENNKADWEWPERFSDDARQVF